MIGDGCSKLVTLTAGLDNCSEIVKSRDMNNSRKILDTVKFKLSDCKDMHKYTSAHQEACDYVCSQTTVNSEMPTKGASMILQTALLMNMGAEYAGIVSTIESEWKNGTANLKSTILRLIKFEAIWKGSSKVTEESNKATVLLFSSNSPKPRSLRAPKDTCTNPECIEKGITTHFTKHCFLKHPELRRALTDETKRIKNKPSQ